MSASRRREPRPAGFSKDTMIRLHAVRRFRERLGIQLTDRLHDELVLLIQAGQGRCVKSPSRNRRVFSVPLPAEQREQTGLETALVVYDRKRQLIVTVLT